MRRLFRFTLLASLGALACATVSVSTDYDPTTKFSSYQSYAWLPDNPTPTGHPRLDSPLVQERIKKAIDLALESKGFARTESPDFLVRYDLSAERRLDVTTYDSGFYRGYGYRMSLPVTEVREYDEGSLIVDILDYHEKKVVWRGVGQGRLRSESASADPAEQQARIDKAVAAVLKDFPPKPK